MTSEKIIQRIIKQLKKEKKYQSLICISKTTQTNYNTVIQVVNKLVQEGKIIKIKTTSGSFYKF